MQSSAVPMLTSEVARLCHVSAETVREWDRTGKLRAARTTSGVRLFDPADVARLRQTERQSEPPAIRERSY